MNIVYLCQLNLLEFICNNKLQVVPFSNIETYYLFPKECRHFKNFCAKSLKKETTNKPKKCYLFCKEITLEPLTSTTCTMLYHANKRIAHVSLDREKTLLTEKNLINICRGKKLHKLLLDLIMECSCETFCEKQH